MKTTPYFLNLFFSFLLLFFSCSQKKENKIDSPVVSETEVTSQEETSNPLQSEPSETENATIQKEVIDAPIVLSESDFSKYVTDYNNPKGFQYKGSIPCIVDFYADWCRPCHALNPILVEVAKKYKGKIIIYKVNVDKSPIVSGAFGIRSIPTLVFFKSNEQPAKVEGAPTQEQLENIID